MDCVYNIVLESHELIESCVAKRQLLLVRVHGCDRAEAATKALILAETGFDINGKVIIRTDWQEEHWMDTIAHNSAADSVIAKGNVTHWRKCGTWSTADDEGRMERFIERHTGTGHNI